MHCYYYSAYQRFAFIFLCKVLADEVFNQQNRMEQARQAIRPKKQRSLSHPFFLKILASALANRDLRSRALQKLELKIQYFKKKIVWIYALFLQLIKNKSNLNCLSLREEAKFIKLAQLWETNND
jgi:hypothetical protein